MSNLDSIVVIQISRQTQTVAQANFGIPGIISEFATDKTITTFDRYREYATLDEMSADGWTSSDPEYKQASIVFSQNPSVEKVIIGRIDSDDANWSAGLDAVASANDDWYAFTIVRRTAVTLVYDADFVASNSITVTVNGDTTSGVTFDTDQATTMDAVIAQIESEISGSSAKLDSDDADNRTIIIELFADDVATASSAVTGGTSQATATSALLEDYDAAQVASWVSSKKKIFLYDSKDPNIKNSDSTTDIAYTLNASASDRTAIQYYPYDASQETNEMFSAGWNGKTAPKDPGSQTWKFKTITGLLKYNLTSAEKNAILGKKANTYTTVGGVNITEDGTVASGEYIDVIRGLDWLESRLQESIYTELVNVDKIPFTDAGVAVVEGAVRGVLNEAARVGLLDPDSIEVTVPLVSAVSTTDRGNRLLPDINFSARLQGAIHKVEVNGVITV